MHEIKNFNYSWLAKIKLPLVADVQQFSHLRAIFLLCADPLWSSDGLGDVRWQSCCWEVPEKIIVSRLSRSQTGSCNFVPGSWSRYWWAGIKSGAAPGFTNWINCGNHCCVRQHGTITKTVAQSCISLASTLPTILMGERYMN